MPLIFIMLLHLMDLLSRLIIIWSWGEKRPHSGDHFFQIERKKTLLIFLSDSSLILVCIMLHLMDLYQYCSYYGPGVKNGPTPGFTCFK